MAASSRKAKKRQAKPRRIGNDHGYKNVLIARFSAIGDVAMTIPVVYSACMCYPDVNFIFVTRQSMTPIFQNKPSNLQVIGIDLRQQYKGPKGLYRLVKEMKQQYGIEAFVDLHDVLRTKMMRFFCRLRGIRTTVVDKGRRHKRALVRQHNKVMLPLVSMRARYREAFFDAGLPVEMMFEGLYGKHGKGDAALFSKIMPPEEAGRKWVGIAPFAAHDGKIYPPELMEQVVQKLCSRGDCTLFIFGGPGREAEIGAEWEKKYPHVLSFAGKKYGFPAEMALFSHLAVMLTMDSSNMHLAAIAGTRTVSIWGATHPYCGFRGWRQKEGDLIQLPLTCRPCSVFGDRKCYRGDMLCLYGIKPETICNKISEIIDK